MDVQILTLLGCPIGKVILSGGNFIWAHSPLEGQSLDWAGILMCAQHVIYAGQSWAIFYQNLHSIDYLWGVGG